MFQYKRLCTIKASQTIKVGFIDHKAAVRITVGIVPSKRMQILVTVILVCHFGGINDVLVPPRSIKSLTSNIQSACHLTQSIFQFPAIITISLKCKTLCTIQALDAENWPESQQHFVESCTSHITLLVHYATVVSQEF